MPRVRRQVDIGPFRDEVEEDFTELGGSLHSENLNQLASGGQFTPEELDKLRRAGTFASEPGRYWTNGGENIDSLMARYNAAVGKLAKANANFKDYASTVAERPGRKATILTDNSGPKTVLGDGVMGKTVLGTI